jgi:hypothetical protein
MTIENAISELLKLVNSFASTEKLSDFERGQLDGLLWAIDVIDEKTPDSSDNESGD